MFYLTHSLSSGFYTLRNAGGGGALLGYLLHAPIGVQVVLKSILRLNYGVLDGSSWLLIIIVLQEFFQVQLHFDEGCSGALWLHLMREPLLIHLTIVLQLLNQPLVLFGALRLLLPLLVVFFHLVNSLEH